MPKDPIEESVTNGICKELDRIMEIHGEEEVIKRIWMWVKQNKIKTLKQFDRSLSVAFGHKM